MRLFSYLDQAIVGMKQRREFAVSEARVWPSEASVEMFDKRKSAIAGKCHRQSFFRMIGKPVTRQVDPKGLWKFELGHACEAFVGELAEFAGIMVASGVRAFSKRIVMGYEIDLILVDPAEDYQGYITENKSYAGFMKAQDLKKGKPSIDNVVQPLLYLLEQQTGKQLKQTIRDSVKETEKRLAAGDVNSHYRTKVILDNLEKMNDGPLKAKLAYEDRSECDTFEFDISLWEDEFDGLHYPCVDGVPWKIFTVESVYERYRILQQHWEDARTEGASRLAFRGIQAPPDDAPRDIHRAYADQIAAEVLRLGSEFWPPAEYDWKYSHEKIEYLWNEGLLSKTAYEEYRMVFEKRNRKPRPLPRLGDWQCNFCQFGAHCIPVEYPEMRSVAHDMVTLDDVQLNAL